MPLRWSILAAAGASASARVFNHPGVLMDQQQIDFVRAQIAAGVEPFKSTLHKALQNTWINQRTVPQGPPMNTSYGPGKIACGYFDHPDYGCAAEGTDSQVALLQSYLWLFTGNVTWAQHAQGIMNHYAQTFTGYVNFENGPLEAAWAADKWARAAEILNSTGSGWAPEDAAAFGRMLQTYSVPMLWNGSCDNGNWELAMVEGLAGIGVFTNNETVLNRSMELWQSRVPSYFYMATDGPAPLPDPLHCGKPWWFNQVVFNASVNGVAQETCRDFGHTGYGVAATFNALETFWAQGIDLYTPHAQRLAAALELHTTQLNRAGNPIPKGVNFTDPLLCSGTPLGLSAFPTYQVGLTGLSRIGYGPAQLPSTTAYVRNILWGEYYNALCSVFMACYEPLTHGAAAPASAAFAAAAAPALQQI